MIYRYKCYNCEAEFDLLIPKEEEVCPECHSELIERQVSAPKTNLGKTPYDEFL